MDEGTPFCTCPVGETCSLPPDEAGGTDGTGEGGAVAGSAPGEARAWGGALLALAALLAAVLAALYLIHRRRR